MLRGIDEVTYLLSYLLWACNMRVLILETVWDDLSQWGSRGDGKLLIEFRGSFVRKA
jgi:hypothetical protein